MSKQITIAIIGAGSRGYHCFANHVKTRFPDMAQVVAVAEPDPQRQTRIQQEHNIPDTHVFEDWQELLEKPKLADAVIIATPDQCHQAPAIAACRKGYHILLEKPLATTEQECKDIADAAAHSHGVFAVCHVLRYAPYYRQIEQAIRSGRIGDVCTIEHLEGVGWWHQAHSYVRGNWANTQKAAPMLLAKSCHDLDLIRCWAGEDCRKVSSFGHLKHFRKEQAPPQASQRCLDCPLADRGCAYSAKKLYGKQLNHGPHNWPLNAVIHEFTSEALEKALRTGPYGRCVYACDNDVVDHQVVLMEFDNQITASFTMTAFTPHGRRTRIMGTKGYLQGDEQTLKLLDFETGQWQIIYETDLKSDLSGGHGGGDQELLREFICSIRDQDTSKLSTQAQEAFQSHRIAFAAETSRITGNTVWV